MRNKLDRIKLTDKPYLTPEQLTTFKNIKRDIEKELIGGTNLTLMSSVFFKPTTEWIETFAEIGCFFYKNPQTDAYEIVYEGVEGMPVFGQPADYIKAAAEEAGIPMEWTPKNGEEIQYVVGKSVYLTGLFIGSDGPQYYVIKDSEGEFLSVQNGKVRQKPRQHEVNMADLMAVYAQAKGIPADSIVLVEEREK